MDSTEGKEALAAICEGYWLPLYAFARRSGCTPEDAEDMTQGFIYSILHSNGLKTADPQKGRLRSFLIKGIKNYMISLHRKESSQIRGGNLVTISIEKAEEMLAEDEGAYAHSSQSPIDVFERRWALALLARVLKLLREEFEQKGEGQIFETLRPYLSGKDRTGDGAYDAAAEKLGMSNSLVGVRVHRMKRRYKEVLRAEIASTVAEDEVESELRHLFSIFQR
ncbi:MAG: DNA-directed RNA polymerase specialized sigma24 family protein [Verrucomicrobiales bacterium]|jgi:DNA-directed RNA polymerase specialized sigma24 family protein